MNVRVEVTEDQWITGLVEADFLVLDLGRDLPRPWLEEARDRVELIGLVPGPADEALLERALDLDVDFLALSSTAPGFDARRLPLRLMVEQPMAGIGETPELFGAAWARRVRDWTVGDEERITSLARQERVFLGVTDTWPDDEWFERVAPFAVAAPEGSDAAAIGRIRGV